MKCMMCKAKLSKGNANHFVDINGHIIIIKNVPANVCKQCGEYYYEHEIALKLEQIVGEYKDSGAEIMIIDYNDKAA
ncbi:MAG: hypothetical protein PWQ96_1656 [Clostridia bacterium]|nr:hypothetical protein [Clostridiales bacterium]MDK2986013.1 hypothetical protein [Clostridia bacterium]